MQVDFRCEKCGKLLQVDGEPGQRVRCTHCRKKVVIPAGLASLPRPRVAEDADVLRVDVEPEADPSDETAVMSALAGAMPWVISGLLHVGLFLVMVFIMMVGASTSTPPPVVAQAPVWTDDGPVGRFDPGENIRGDNRRARKEVVRPKPHRETQIEVGETKSPVELLAMGGQSVGEAAGQLGLRNRRGTDGPGTGMFGPGGRAYHVVYVIDRSGSMAPHLDDVKAEMARSIGRLVPRQDFHIIFFSNNRTIEGPRNGLVPAEYRQKSAAGKFILDVRASGRTTALVALKRAFAVLKDADRTGRGKIIYLLTDGDFSGVTGGSIHRTKDGRKLNGNEAVVEWLRENNAKGEVQVYTRLFRQNDPAARKVLQTIAELNHGRFKYVSPDE